MKLKEKVIKRIWKESVATLVIISVILIISGHKNNNQSIVPMTTHIMVSVEAEELPSVENNVIEVAMVEQKTTFNIEQLVADVNSGKAGNGNDRKIYLGEHYNEVQAIINEQYNDQIIESTNETVVNNTILGTKQDYQNYAHELCISMGWTEDDFLNLIKLWEKESGWNPNAHNKSSGAHGIPQSLPASKMSSQGDDYYINGYTQIRWGLNYILNRYNTPTNAWQHFQAKNWY